MSKVLNTSDSYDIINRKEILADSNTSAIGSLNTAISNPVQKDDGAYLLSRIGNAGNTDRKPIPGYCLHFDSVNVIASAPVFIQTNIPSVERSNYNIVIKGEGTIDLLQVDTSDTNIRIVPKQAITDSAYFDLSYIAFRNITTGKIDHLFECEENSGMLLYDAVTGDTATITSTSGNIVSLTALRGFTSYKEWIIDEDENLKNSIKCNSVYGGISALRTVPAEVSLCITIKITQEEYDPIGPINILGMINGTSYFCLSKRPENYWMPGFTWAYKNANLAEESGFEVKLGYYSGVMSAILDGKPHKLVCCIGDRTKEALPVLSDYSDKGLKFFLDGVAVNDNIGGRNKQFLNVPTEFNATNTFGIGTSTNYTLNGGCTISNVKYFNFDISAEGAAYTLDDYQNDKDVPSELLLNSGTNKAILSLNNVSNTLWVDSSVNKYNATLSGTLTLPNKEYGTWLNAVGYNNTTVLLDPTIYNSVIWGNSGWYNAHFTVRSVEGDSLIATHTGADVSRLSTLLIFTYSNYQFNGKKIHIRVDDIRCTIADGSYTDARPDQLVVFVNKSINGVTKSQRLVTVNNYSATDGKLVLDFDIPDDWENISRLALEIYFSSTVAITANDFVKYKGVKVWIDDFENITIPEATLNKFTNPKLPRKIINNNILSVTDIVATTSNAEALTTKTGEILSLK